MTVIEVDPLSDPRWLALVTRRRSDVFHAPAWLAVLADTYGFTLRALILLDRQDQPVAGIPYCDVEDIFGVRRVSLPFSDYCDPLLDSQEQWSLLSEPYLAGGGPVAVRCLHNDVLAADGRFSRSAGAHWHGLNLTGDENALWEQLHGSARRAVRKARKAGVVVRAAAQPELRRFFDLHVGVRKYKYRLIAQPYDFFAHIWRRFVEPGNGRLLVAVYKETIIGAVLFLDWQRGLYYKFNASHPDYLALRPNDLIMWTGIADARKRGFTHVDFGLSDSDQPGLIRYKRKFAGSEKTIAFLRRPPTTPPNPHAGELRAAFNRLTDLLTHPDTPDALTGQAGDILYRYFT